MTDLPTTFHSIFEKYVFPEGLYFKNLPSCITQEEMRYCVLEYMKSFVVVFEKDTIQLIGMKHYPINMSAENCKVLCKKYKELDELMNQLFDWLGYRENFYKAILDRMMILSADELGKIPQIKNPISQTPKEIIIEWLEPVIKPVYLKNAPVLKYALQEYNKIIIKLVATLEKVTNLEAQNAEKSVIIEPEIKQDKQKIKKESKKNETRDANKKQQEKKRQREEFERQSAIAFAHKKEQEKRKKAQKKITQKK